MNKITSFLSLLFAFTVLFLTTSCGDDGQTIVNPLLKFEGTYVGTHSLNGLVPFPDKDTVKIEVDTTTNIATLRSALLENVPFEADYNSSNDKLIVTDLEFETLVFGDQIFYGLGVNSGNVDLNNDESELFITLNGISIDSGDVNLSAIGLDYPITPADNINMKTFPQDPFQRQ